MKSRYIIVASLFLATKVLAAQCVVSGCNGELCTTVEDQQVASICIWQEDYQCYADFGVCEADKKGKCGWRQTVELQQCLNVTKEADADNPDPAQ